MNHPHCCGHDIHGVLPLDKPQDMSSNDVLQKVKRIYNANRAEHTGALDPLAAGMLPIYLGEAIKLSQYLPDSDKRYRVVTRLGQHTDISDAGGQVMQERPVTFIVEQLVSVLETLHSDIEQIPSMHPVLKYQGKKLYEYARQGIEVPREAHPITVYELLFIRHKGNELELEVRCSKGAYIRTIVDDLGEKLGCGVYVTYLRRLAASKYPVDRMVALKHLRELVRQAEQQNISTAQLLDPLLMPMDSPASDYPAVNSPLTSPVCFKNGGLVRATGAPLERLVRVTESGDDEFTGMRGMDDKGRVAPRRLVIEYPAQCSLSRDKGTLRVEHCRLTPRELFNNLRGVYTKLFELH